MERGLSFIPLNFIIKGVTAVTWILLVGGIFGYLLIAFEIVKVVSYFAGVVMLFVLIDFFLRGFFLSENKKKDNNTNPIFLFFSLLNFISDLLLLGLAVLVQFSQ